MKSARIRQIRLIRGLSLSPCHVRHALRIAHRRQDDAAHEALHAMPAGDELGVFGMAIPERWGGAGLDVLTLALALEEIAAGDGATSTIDFDRRQPGGEGGVGRRSHRRRDPHRQCARGQLVVGEERECGIHRMDEFGRRASPPGACQACGEAPGAARGTEHDRRGHEQPSGGISRSIVGMTGGEDVARGCDAGDRRADPRTHC